MVLSAAGRSADGFELGSGVGAVVGRATAAATAVLWVKATVVS